MLFDLRTNGFKSTILTITLPRYRLGSSAKKGGKGVRALRGYFGPIYSQKQKVAFHKFHLIGLLEE